MSHCILRGWLLLPDAPFVRLAFGWLEVENGVITKVSEGDCPHAADLGGDDWIITPGFVDLHAHLPQFDSIGCDGMTLLEWLETAIYPAERLWADPDYAFAMTRRVLDQFLAHGTTSFAVYASVHHDATRKAIAACEERGLRCAVGQSVSDMLFPDDLKRPAGTQLDEVRTLLVEQRRKMADGTSRVEFAVTPRFAGSCTKELMAGLGRLAREHDAIVQSHLSETRAECELIAKLHGGPNYTSIYQEAELLTPRTLLGHGIWLDDSERSLLHESGAIIAHCPTANIFLQSGAMDRQAHQQAKVRLALGSDIGAGYERSMIRVARAMINIAKSLGHPFPSAAECWHQITAGNADVIGWPMIGRLAPSAEADILLLKPDVPWQSADDPLAKLLYSWDDRWLKHTLIAGKQEVGHLARHDGRMM